MVGPGPRHTKDVKMASVATLLGAHHYKASITFPIFQIYNLKVIKDVLIINLTLKKK